MDGSSTGTYADTRTTVVHAAGTLFAHRTVGADRGGPAAGGRPRFPSSS
ncbi:hypothetical protein [Kineococcus sp. NPDC059986]